MIKRFRHKLANRAKNQYLPALALIDQGVASVVSLRRGIPHAVQV